jgi:hypothetical protein
MRGRVSGGHTFELITSRELQGITRRELHEGNS